MSLTTYKIEQANEWNDVVYSFNNYDVYYLSEYVKAFQIHGDGEPVLLYIENDGCRAINVVMRRDVTSSPNLAGKIPEGKYFDFSTPYGYGGFVVDGVWNSKMEADYSNYCIKNGIVCEFVRFNPLLKNIENSKNIYDTTFLGNTVFMDIKNEKEIWNNLTSKNRNVIRKAKNSGLKVFWGRDENLLDEFINIYNDTMTRDKAEAYYFFEKDFYKSILYDLKDNSLFFYSKLGDEIVSMSIMMFCNKKMHYHFSASKKEYQNLAPTNLLLFEAACFGSRMGFEQLHLGGGVGCHKDSLYSFKKAFNRGEDVDFYIGRKIIQKDVYDMLVKTAEVEPNGFFPVYRTTKSTEEQQ